MSVSVFPAPATGGAAGSETAFAATVANTISIVPFAKPAGIFVVRAWASDNTTPVVQVTAVDSSDNAISTFSLLDIDSGNTANFAEKIVRLTTDVAKFSVTSNKDGFIAFETTTTLSSVEPTITSYTTSQSVVIANPSSIVLIGGGAGGGGDFNGYGGGSGFQASGTIAPGTYDLVIGAGGSHLANGGTSTFHTFTAGGGTGATGGSGGGSLDGGGATPALRVGGFNGGNGGGGNAGSGVGLWWIAAGAPGQASTASETTQVGTGGGLYAGGGGGTNISPALAGFSAASGTGGGGGGGARQGLGGNGGSGVLYVGEGF